MCEICRMSPCHSRCPNAPDTPVCKCEICGENIYAGEVMYVIEGENICENCIDRGRTYAELDT